MNLEPVEVIVKLLEDLSRTMDALTEAGQGIPAVEKNVTRMRGALHVIDMQFTELATVRGAGSR